MRLQKDFKHSRVFAAHIYSQKLSPPPSVSSVLLRAMAALPWWKVFKVLLLLTFCQFLTVFLYYSWTMLRQQDQDWQRTCDSCPNANSMAAFATPDAELEEKVYGSHRGGHHVLRQVLSQNESSVATEFASHRKQGNMIVGILVAKREKPTIYNLLDHLLREPRVTEDFIIIVHVAYSVSRDEELLGYLRQLKDLVVTIVEEEPYPEAMEENIPDTRGDSMERTVWRTTHGEVAASADVHTQCKYMSASLECNFW